MKTFNKLLCALSLIAASTAQAHDPSMHKENVEKANCASMKDMDHSTMDANDPVVMQAMMKRCAGQMKQKEHTDHKESHGEHAEHNEGHTRGTAQEQQEK
ncbi:hypothetical protein M0G74_05850 [Microbulbifer sp. CAU 1566]|uniref:hypothetical protein n=1 Tax=Microbulbifer sp. CAU 1566 TaxID=2933269 RepID=UPI0020030E59|nr:hypothetical protein [Microbulbifer sp. CAU 1566]MCK7596793.1 hypothetical protein [Microbulbifer sp. CAU 1566]